MARSPELAEKEGRIWRGSPTAATVAKAPKIEWDERASAARNARRHLPELMSWYFALGRDLLARNASPQELHLLRLATKRLRYTLDLFREVYGPALEERMGELRHLQQLLGELNDTVAAGPLLTQAVAGRLRPGIAKFLERRLNLKLQEFGSYWSETFDAPGRETEWIRFLGIAAAASPRV